MKTYKIERLPECTFKDGVNFRTTDLYHTGSEASAIKRAITDLDKNALEGQYSISTGHCGDFIGYAIKYPDEPAYFERD